MGCGPAQVAAPVLMPEKPPEQPPEQPPEASDSKRDEPFKNIVAVEQKPVVEEPVIVEEPPKPELSEVPSVEHLEAFVPPPPKVTVLEVASNVLGGVGRAIVALRPGDGKQAAKWAGAVLSEDSLQQPVVKAKKTRRKKDGTSSSNADLTSKEDGQIAQSVTDEKQSALIGAIQDQPGVREPEKEPLDEPKSQHKMDEAFILSQQVQYEENNDIHEEIHKTSELGLKVVKAIVNIDEILRPRANPKIKEKWGKRE